MFWLKLRLTRLRCEVDHRRAGAQTACQQGNSSRLAQIVSSLARMKIEESSAPAASPAPAKVEADLLK
jgi:hypothetical protein